jgi:4-carboxymuconolactone decarboxylase
MAARIPLFPLADMTPEQRRVYEAASAGPGGPVRGPTAAVLHNPELAEKWRGLGDMLRHKTSLSLALSELAILVVARRWTAQFVWFTHATVGAKAGIAAETIEAIRNDRRPTALAGDAAVVYDFATELAERGAVSDAAYAAAQTCLGTVGVVELTALVGYYSMVAMTVNAHAVPVPDGTTPLAPRVR